MVIDDVTITIKAGNGGNGAATFLRNALKPKGGPDGGNGGKGGDVYLMGSDDLGALQKFKFKKEWKATDGGNGAKQNLYGKAGDDLIITVPIGTVIHDMTSNKTYEINVKNDRLLIAKGGAGGRGNNEFKSPTLQTPKFAEHGGEGEEKIIRLELKLIADIGFIGLPNAGKSSLLKSLTNADPKIGNYPFTTLEPNIGMMDAVALADIPGLIEGASAGKGLGIKFLKHIEKTKLLVHCIDASDPSPLQTYKTVREEFEAYNKKLLEKPELVLLTKKDLISDTELNEKIHIMTATGREIHTSSVYDEESLRNLKKIILLATQ